MSIALYLFLLLQAIAGLNGMQLGEKKLIVQRASVGAKNAMNQVLIADDSLRVDGCDQCMNEDE